MKQLQYQVLDCASIKDTFDNHMVNSRWERPRTTFGESSAAITLALLIWPPVFLAVCCAEACNTLPSEEQIICGQDIAERTK